MEQTEDSLVDRPGELDDQSCSNENERELNIDKTNDCDSKHRSGSLSDASDTDTAEAEEDAGLHPEEGQECSSGNELIDHPIDDDNGEVTNTQQQTSKENDEREHLQEEINGEYNVHETEEGSASEDEKDKSKEEQAVENDISQNTQESQEVESDSETGVKDNDIVDSNQVEEELLQSLSNEAKYRRAASLGSLSVNVGSLQQESDTEDLLSPQETHEDDIEETPPDPDGVPKKIVESDDDGGFTAHNDAEEEDLTHRKEDDAETNQQDTDQREDSSDIVDDDSKDDQYCKDNEVDEDGETEDMSDVSEKQVPEVLVSFENAEKEQKSPNETIVEDSDEASTKVKELGKIFQEKTDETPTTYAKQSPGEKSPVSVRRFREIFEHGELLLSPAAYFTVPEDEVTSPRPGIVKSMCDLFENPQSFDWKETPKTATAVN